MAVFSKTCTARTLWAVFIAFCFPGKKLNGQPPTISICLRNLTGADILRTTKESGGLDGTRTTEAAIPPIASARESQESIGTRRSGSAVPRTAKLGRNASERMTPSGYSTGF
jgi:hypothetical protein